MNMINYIDNQAETEKVGSRTVNLQQPDIPYPFQPYLSPLYHVAPPLYLAMFPSFGRHSDKGIDALKKGVSSLSAHLHFLTGVVPLSSQPAGKDEVYEVRPASATFLQTYPMFQVGIHPELDLISPDDS